jgi:pyruvate dehydrogenase E1 component
MAGRAGNLRVAASSDGRTRDPARTELIETLSELERRVLWLATYTIHNANHLRPNVDGLKVGGHQSSCASIVSLMTALYFHTLQKNDRIAVKPHASPILHAIQYLMGHQTQERLERFRAMGGAQSYPSRTKDKVEVDFSTGSVGLGAAAPLFASLVQDYVQSHDFADRTPGMGRMIALIGDAELDEGNIYEALLEGWKHEVRNLWWIIDYNRQSLDGVVNDQLFSRIQGLFENVGWKVVTLKYGEKLKAAGQRPYGKALLDWIDRCPNQLYSALTFQGGPAWRVRLTAELAGVRGLDELLAHSDDELAALMTNLGGHDIETILNAFDEAGNDETPHCFVAYTIKGMGLPLQGHKDNHAGLMNPTQLAKFQEICGVPAGQEWEPFAGARLPKERLEQFIAATPMAARPKRATDAPVLEIPHLATPKGASASTQEIFGKVMHEIAQSDAPFARRVVTTAPDVTVSTNLSGWVNRLGVFHREDRADVFRREKIPSTQKWDMSGAGQHIELGIAEINLFLLLGQLGLSADLFGSRLLPVGTVYDPFVNRGLDALIYACYQGARFMLVGTPSGIALAPEGGAHQSVNTPLIGMAQDGLTYFEPAFGDELAAIMEWGFKHMQADDGGSVYLRLTTRSIDQIQRPLDPAAVIEGGYWLKRPEAGVDLAVVYAGAVAPEAIAAHEAILEDVPGAGLLAVTSPDQLHAGWLAAQKARRAGDRNATCHVERLLGELAPDAALVTVIDGHPATLSWMGGVRRQHVASLGVTKFGQSASLDDLFKLHGLDSDSIVDAAAEALGRRIGERRGH